MAGHRRGPDFLGIGAQKAATTWLYENLSRHPQIAFPAGKEIHFWDERAGRAATAWLDLFPPVGPGTKQGEITPAYAFLGLDAIRELGAAVPDLRLFYSLRNPIDRAWSSALMELRHAEMTIDEASDQWFIDHFNSSGSRRRGDYAACLSHWQAVFPADRLHVILFDDLVARPGETLTRLAEHARLASRTTSCPRRESRTRTLSISTSTMSTPTTAGSRNGCDAFTASPRRTCRTTSAGVEPWKPWETRVNPHDWVLGAVGMGHYQQIKL